MARTQSGYSSAWLAFVAMTGVCVGLMLSTVFDKPANVGGIARMERFLSSSENLEEEASPVVITTVVVVAVLFLVFLTIIFEKLKHLVEESAERNLTPILESLFGEMTVLGFVSVVAYIISKLGVFEILSSRWFGNSHEVVEMFETVHYTLFFIMIFFCTQVVVMVAEAKTTACMWLQLNRACVDPDYMATIYNSWKQESFWQRRRHQLMDEILLFHGLREEFILERSVEPPFDPVDSIHRATDDFNFGRYLSICFGNTLAHVVDVQVPVWCVIAIETVAFYGLVLAVGCNFVVVAWIWTFFGWYLWGFCTVMEWGLHNVLQGFAASEVPPAGLPISAISDETTPLNGSKSMSRLPAWCKVDLDDYMKNRPWIGRCIGGNKTVNRQHTLFVFERKGPKIQVLAMQAALVVEAIYASLQLITFFPMMYARCSPAVFCVYVILAVLPLIPLRLSKAHLFAISSQVSSIGSFRRPEFVATVIRENKTTRLVRKLIVVYKMYRAAESGNVRTTQVDYTLLLDKFEIAELSKTFDMFDTSGKGSVPTDDFEKVLSMLFTGGLVKTVDFKHLVNALDRDGNGRITKDEFLQWYANFEVAENETSMKDRARIMYGIFDKDGNGELSPGELKSALDTLNIGFSIVEIGALLEELKGHGDGLETSPNRFELLVERYYPKERHHSNEEDGSVMHTGMNSRRTMVFK